MTSKRILTIIAAAVVLIAFFMPWLSLMFWGNSSAFDIDKRLISAIADNGSRAIQTFDIMLSLILLVFLPICAIVIIINEAIRPLNKKTDSVASIIIIFAVSLFSIIFAIYFSIKNNVDVVNFFTNNIGSGFYLNIIASIGFIVTLCLDEKFKKTSAINVVPQIELLEKLANLKEGGHLSEDEFQQQKNNILIVNPISNKSSTIDNSESKRLNPKWIMIIVIGIVSIFCLILFLPGYIKKSKEEAIIKEQTERKLSEFEMQMKQAAEQMNQQQNIQNNNTTTNNSGIQETSNQITFISYNPCTFGISLPSNFKIKSMYSDSSPDRCDYSVKTEDGFEIIQLHSLLSSRFETNNIKELYNKALKNKTLKITYKSQKGNWFVVSGTSNENENIVYWKRISGANFISDMRIEYPKNRASQIEQYISKIQKSFTSQ
jgi:hypothetical protein